MIVEQKKTAEVEVTHIKQTHAHQQKIHCNEHIPTNPGALVFPSSTVVSVVQQQYQHKRYIYHHVLSINQFYVYITNLTHLK